MSALLAVRWCSLFIYYVLFVALCVCLLFGPACCSLRAVRCLLCVVCWMVSDVWWLLLVARCLPLVV